MSYHAAEDQANKQRDATQAAAHAAPAHDVVEGEDGKRYALNTVGLAVMQQQELIPTTGERKPTTNWEYWTYCVFCELPTV